MVLKDFIKKYENFISILLSQIWGQEQKNKVCREYVFEYINMIEEIVKQGIKKKELVEGDSSVIASGIFGFICSTMVYKLRHEKDLEIQKIYKEIEKDFISKLKK